jgi:predicted DCC family thiol-disulfide oxidoreductase YuxK
VTGEGSLIVIFDGACSRCSRSMRWATRHARVTLVQYSSVTMTDEDLAHLALEREDVDRQLWCIDERGSRYGGASAVAQILARCVGAARIAGRLMSTRIGEAVAEPVYQLVASRRRRTQCDVTPMGSGSTKR